MRFPSARTLSTLAILAWLGIPCAMRGQATSFAFQIRCPSPNCPELQAALLSEDWPAVSTLLSTQQAPEARLITAHAYLARNKNNESLCLFLSVSSHEELTKWEAWTRAFATQHPASAIAHYLKGDALARLEQWPAALAAFNKALELHPNRALALNARGVVHASQGQWDPAVVDLDDAIRANPSLADAHTSRGTINIQRRTGAPGALEAFNRALRLSPDSVVALNGRAALRTVLRQFEEAEPDLAEARKHATGCLAPVLEALSANAAALAYDKSQAAAQALAEIAQLEPGMNMTRSTEIMRGMSPDQVAFAKGALRQQNWWTNFTNFGAPDKVTERSNFQASVNGKIFGVGPAVAYGAGLNLQAGRDVTIERFPRATAREANTWRSQTLSMLDSMYPDIKPQTVGPLGGYNFGRAYPELSKPDYGGVRTARIGASPLEQGDWHAAMMYGLFYSVKSLDANGPASAKE